MDSSYKIGVFWSFTSAFLWSTTFITARYLMKDNLIDSISLSLCRFLIGGAVLFIIGMVFFRKKFQGIRNSDLLRLAGLGFFGIVGMSVFLFLGQANTTAINSSMIMQSNPVIVLFAGLLIGEKIKRIQILGIFVSLLGCMFVVDIITSKGFAYSCDHLKGDFFVLIAAICWVIYSVFGKNVVKRIGGYAATTLAMVFGAFELILIRLALPCLSFIVNIDFKLPDTAFDWSLILYLALFPTAVAFFAWYEAMDRIELSLLSVMQYLTPVFTIFLAVIILSEKITIFKGIGILLVLAGVMLIAAERKKTEIL